MLKVALTFDYELFLGENFSSSEEILFNPTQNIAEKLIAKDVRGTFFADVCSVQVHEKFGLMEYANNFRNQIGWLTKIGHDIQLHLHTNWLNSTVKDGKIKISAEGYRIHSFGFKKTGVEKIINDGKKILEEECLKYDKKYKCIAYRAGGFAIQPEGELIEALVKNGIVIESSVLPFMKSDTVNAYNFTDVPNQVNWWINSKTGLSKDVGNVENAMYEVPILTARPSLYYFTRNVEERHLPYVPLKGGYVKSEHQNEKAEANFLQSKFSQIFDYRYPTLDEVPYKVVYDYLIRAYKKYKLNNYDGYLCLICHPKLLDSARIENIIDLVDLVNNDNRFSFVTMQDIYNEQFK